MVPVHQEMMALAILASAPFLFDVQVLTGPDALILAPFCQMALMHKAL